MGKKFKETLIFIGILIASVVTASLLTYAVGRIFFGVFESYKIPECPNPPPPGCGWHGYNPITLHTYPGNILIPFSIITFVVSIIAYSLIAVRTKKFPT